MTEKKATMGMKIAGGILSTRIVSLLMANPNTSMVRDAQNRMAAIWGMKCGNSKESMGPGLTPCNQIAPKSIAAGGEPGTPRVKRGMSAPPIQELFAVSAEITPSIVPLPNCSGSLLDFFAIS